MYKYIICVQVTTQTAAISLGGQSSESPQPTSSVPTHIPAGELTASTYSGIRTYIKFWFHNTFNKNFILFSITFIYAYTKQKFVLLPNALAWGI